MGMNAAGGSELAPTVVTGTFGAIGNGTAGSFIGNFNVSLWGTFVGTAILERSFDGGTTFLPVSKDLGGTANSFTAPMTIAISEPEPGVLYRFRCSAWTSGTINYRLSGGVRLT